MLLKRHNIFIPTVIFSVISIGFWIIQLNFFDIIGWNYNFCHALFGFTFPIIFSHLGLFPRTHLKKTNLPQIFRHILAIPPLSWPLSFLRLVGCSIARDFNDGIPWMPLVGVAITLCFSIGNEIFIDPAMNRIPFTYAYENFVADLLGMTAFLLAAWPIVRKHRHSTVSQTTETSLDKN